MRTREKKVANFTHNNIVLLPEAAAAASRSAAVGRFMGADHNVRILGGTWLPRNLTTRGLKVSYPIELEYL